ncbi:hypothetical protein [Pontibacter russatus]|uniref:hypothetical protein n=1 Tax=Pontibacter russatus TaxID=2694929 RepID=UPI0013799FD2|nr:hypothetical protein [Pontibacter russatus]
MRTKADKTVPYIIMGYGMIFIIPAVVSPSLGLTSPAGLFWCCVGGVLFVLPGLWKIEYYEIEGNKLFKYNLFGLIKRVVDLTTLLRYKTKLVNTDYISNPLNVVRFFSKDLKYLKFRKLTLQFEDSVKMTIDERTIDKDDFNILLNKVTGFKGKRKK